MNEITRILSRINQGDVAASSELLPLVYEELRKLAAAWLAREKPGQTLQATALVHEAYARLVGGDAEPEWDSRGHFFAAAAEAIRRILVENARRKSRVKHGGGRQRVELNDVAQFTDDRRDELLAVHEALEKFAEIEPAKAELIKLRYFAGLTIDEAAAVLRVSRGTAKRHWRFARAWLRAEMHEDDEDN